MLRNLIYRLADHFAFQTEDARQYFSKKIADRGVVIPNPLAKEMKKDFSGEKNPRYCGGGKIGTAEEPQNAIAGIPVI